MNRPNTASKPDNGLCERRINSIAGSGRTAIIVVVTLLVVGATGIGTLASATAQPGNESGNTTTTTQSGQNMTQFAVKQGDNCYTVTALGDGSENSTSFYNYRGAGSGYSSRGTTDLQMEATSQFFFYRGNNGLSLVFLHDQFTGNGSTGGGAVTLEMHGLPVTGGWTVKDDVHTGATDSFRYNESVAIASWAWGGGRSDGGVYQANPSTWDSRMRIIPHFNREAATYPAPAWEGEETPNQVQRWVVRSGDGQTHALNLYEPVVINRGTCAAQNGSNQQTGSTGGGSGSNAGDQMNTDTGSGSTTTGDGSSGGTEATGPGFGLALTVLAMAVALIALLRRR